MITPLDDLSVYYWDTHGQDWLDQQRYQAWAKDEPVRQLQADYLATIQRITQELDHMRRVQDMNTRTLAGLSAWVNANR